MRAIVLDGRGVDGLLLRDVAVPDLTDDRVLVRVRASSVNASDYHSVRGGLMVSIAGRLLGRRAQPQLVRGGDVAGVVEAVGKNVTGLRPGDLVFGIARGAWAEYATGTERSLVLKPAGISFEQAAATGVAAVTALQALRDHGHVRRGQRVLVYGAGGGVGTFAVQLAKALGAHVTAVTGPRNLDVVQALRPDALLDLATARAALRGARFDAVLDVAGTRPLGELLRLVAPGGTFVVVGAAKGPTSAILARLLGALFRARVLKQPVAFFVASMRHDDLAYLATLLEAGQVRPAIERTYPLAETAEAVRYAMSGQARAKIAITVGNEAAT